VVVGFAFVQWSRFSSFPAPPGGQLRETALLLLFAYAGFENTPAAAGEYKNPRRDVPFAMLVMLVVVTSFYVAVQFVAYGTFPLPVNPDTSLAEAAGQFAGGWGALLLTVGAAISILGNISNTTLMGPRYLFALADDGFGPRALARVHPRYHTPANAIVAQMAIALVLALTGSFVQLAMLSIIARLTTYIGTAAAVPVLRRRFADRANALRLPGGPTIPIAALLVSLAFLASAQMRNLVAGVIALAIGAVIYRFRREPRRAPPVTPA
jgi:basic amino acid/polyamine antiporter, APA family